MPARTYHLEIRVDEDGNLVGSVPDLVGVHSKGRSLEELERRADDAVADHLDLGPELRGRRSFVRNDATSD